MKKLIKNTLCIVTALLLIIQTGNLLVYYTLFKLNQGNLIEEVCEKKITECNACCFLNKKMAEDDDDSKTGPTGKSSSKTEFKISECRTESYSSNELREKSFIIYSNTSQDIFSGYIEISIRPPRS